MLIVWSGFHFREIIAIIIPRRKINNCPCYGWNLKYKNLSLNDFSRIISARSFQVSTRGSLQRLVKITGI